MNRPKCLTKYCRRRARKHRRFCHTCRSRLYAAAHPDIISFNNLKKSARRRGIPFSLTIEQFRTFAARYDYLNRRGRSAESYTVDRKRSWEGYHAGNLQVLTNRKNAAKNIADRKRAYVMAKVHGWVYEMKPF